jgi:hypothetical protein
MEIADVRRRVMETIERARHEAGERRSRATEAAREYELFLDRIAIPIVKQVANVLRVEGFAFTVFTPAGSVRLMSDRAAEDFVEIALDTTGQRPMVTGHASRIRGRRVVESEEALGEPQTLGEEQLLAFVLKGLGPLVER